MRPRGGEAGGAPSYELNVRGKRGGTVQANRRLAEEEVAKAADAPGYDELNIKGKRGGMRQRRRRKQEEKADEAASYGLSVKGKRGGMRQSKTREEEGPTAEELEEQELKKKKMEEQAFYFKMMADQFRYKAEFNPHLQYIKDDAVKTYQKATDIAVDYLEPYNLTRLGIALGYSVFIAEITGDYDKAIGIAKPAFEAAVKLMESLEGAQYEQSTLIMQLLRDNMMIWTEDKKK